MKTIAIIKLTEFMCDNKKTLVIKTDSNFVHYNLYGGHADSGISHCITNLDQSGLLPDEFNDGESDAQLLKRIQDILISKRLCKSIVKSILRK